jgi:hypothetical protein
MALKLGGFHGKHARTISTIRISVASPLATPSLADGQRCGSSCTQNLEEKIMNATSLRIDVYPRVTNCT